jgi:hypothetical protein
LCLWNEPDYFKLEPTQDGIMRIHTTIAGEGENPSTELSFQLFTATDDGFESHFPLAGENGVFLSDTKEWLNIEAGTYYLKVYSGYAFPYCYNYTIAWETIPMNFTNDTEPNSTFSTAAFLEYNTSV